MENEKWLDDGSGPPRENAKGGISWRVTSTPLNLDKATELIGWIESTEKEEGVEIAPVFWKRLET